MRAKTPFDRSKPYLTESIHSSITYPRMHTYHDGSSNATDLLNVILAGRFVGSLEEAGGVFAEPLGQLVEFFAEAVDGLLVHVCLGDEFGEGD